MRFSKIFRFTLGSRILAIKLNIWNQQLHTHYGITNEVPGSDRLVIPFWDFQENISLDAIIHALSDVQDEEFIGDIYVLQTYPHESYRALSFSPTTWQRYIKILASTSFIDWSYLKHSVMRGRAVIRVSEKVGTKNKLVHIIKARNPPSILDSLHHRAFFASLKIGIAPVFPMPHKVRVRLSKYESFR